MSAANISPGMPRFRFLGPVSVTMSWVCYAVAALGVLSLVAMIGGSIYLASGGPEALKTAGFTMRMSADSFPGVTTHGPSTAVEAMSVSPLMSPSGIAGMTLAVGTPICAMIWGLWHGGGMFRRLARGEYFGRPTIAALRNFAVGLLIYKLAPLITLPLFGWLLMAMDAEAMKPLIHHEPNFTYTLNPMEMDGFLTVIFLGLIVIFAQIMTKAAEIAEDNAQIV